MDVFGLSEILISSIVNFKSYLKISTDFKIVPFSIPLQSLVGSLLMESIYIYAIKRCHKPNKTDTFIGKIYVKTQFKYGKSRWKFFYPGIEWHTFTIGLNLKLLNMIRILQEQLINSSKKQYYWSQIRYTSSKTHSTSGIKSQLLKL